MDLASAGLLVLVDPRTVVLRADRCTMVAHAVAYACWLVGGDCCDKRCWLLLGTVLAWIASKALTAFGGVFVTAAWTPIVVNPCVNLKQIPLYFAHGNHHWLAQFTTQT